MSQLKRMRLREKTSAPSPLPRKWRRLNEPDPADDDKVTEWYAHPASMLAEHPLSEDAQRARELRPVLGPEPKTADLRALMKTLPIRAAHSFQYKGEWKSLSVPTMATFYEDAVLHEVGNIRMAEWWAAQRASKAPLRTGAALTFWYSLDNSANLPDAIEAGAKSTLLAEFEAVFCLTYQEFINMPPHVKVLDCNEVIPYALFEAVLKDGAECTKGFIAVLATWIELVAAEKLQQLDEFDAVTMFDMDSLWQSRSVPPQHEFGHASATLAQNPVSFENFDKPRRLERLTYEYCNKPRDFKKIATPIRWPRGSPALSSLVRRIMPMVSPFGSWFGGDRFESIMDTMWDTFNNWGLRASMNDAMVHTPVPWYSAWTA